MARRRRGKPTMAYNYYKPDNFDTMCVQTDDADGYRKYKVMVFEAGKNRNKNYDSKRFLSAEEAQGYLDILAASEGWLPCPE